MSSSNRLGELLSSEPIPLDRAVAVAGAVDEGPEIEAAVVAALDELARALPTGSEAGDIVTYVFGHLGFHGNTRQYYDPSNSKLHSVIERRTGLPLALAVVVVEIARRVDVELLPIGMPGHFLVADVSLDSGGKVHRFFDPFAGGQELDLESCRVLYERLRPNQPFSLEMLRPVPPAAIVARTLQNLRMAYLRQGDVSRLANIVGLRVGMDGSSLAQRQEYANILGALGRSDLAAEQFDILATLQPEQVDSHERAAFRHRARRN